MWPRARESALIHIEGGMLVWYCAVRAPVWWPLRRESLRKSTCICRRMRHILHAFRGRKPLRMASAGSCPTCGGLFFAPTARHLATAKNQRIFANWRCRNTQSEVDCRVAGSQGDGGDCRQEFREMATILPAISSVPFLLRHFAVLLAPKRGCATLAGFGTTMGKESARPRNRRRFGVV
jgi:hypothetical protein